MSRYVSVGLTSISHLLPSGTLRWARYWGGRKCLYQRSHRYSQSSQPWLGPQSAGEELLGWVGHGEQDRDAGGVQEVDGNPRGGRMEETETKEGEKNGWFIFRVYWPFVPAININIILKLSTLHAVEFCGEVTSLLLTQTFSHVHTNHLLLSFYVSHFSIYWNSVHNKTRHTPPLSTCPNSTPILSRWRRSRTWTWRPCSGWWMWTGVATSPGRSVSQSPHLKPHLSHSGGQDGGQATHEEIRHQRREICNIFSKV